MTENCSDGARHTEMVDLKGHLRAPPFYFLWCDQQEQSYCVLHLRAYLAALPTIHLNVHTEFDPGMVGKGVLRCYIIVHYVITQMVYCVHRLHLSLSTTQLPPVMPHSGPMMSMFRFCWLFAAESMYEKNGIVTSPVVDVSIGTRKTLLSRKEVNGEAIFLLWDVVFRLSFYRKSSGHFTTVNWEGLFRSEREPRSCRG